MAKTFPVNIPLNVQRGTYSDEVLKDLRDAYNGVDGAVERLSKKLNEPIKVSTQVIVDVATGQEVDRQVKKSTTTLDQYTTSLNKNNRAQEDSVTSLRQQVNSARQARDGLTKYAEATNAAGQQVLALTPRWELANQKVQELTKSLQLQEASFVNLFGKQIQLPDFSQLLSIGNKITQIGAAVAVVAGAFIALNAAIQPIIQRAIQIEGLKLALTSFGLSAEQSNGALQTAANTALSYGASLSQVERAYKRLVPVILSSGGSLAESDQIIASLVARTTALGLNTEQSNRYIEAFAQVMGKGKLQAEELNQQFSELDGSLRSQLASYLKTTYGITDLESAMKNGAITAEIFRAFIVESAEGLRTKLAGDADYAQQRVLGLNQAFNPQQIQNYTDTLNTLSLGGLAQTFGDVGRIVASLQLQFAQFFNILTTKLPNMSALFGFLGEIIATAVITPISALLTILTVLFVSIEKGIAIGVAAFNTIKQAITDFINSVPGGTQALGLLSKASETVGTVTKNAFGFAQEGVANLTLGTREATEAVYEQANAEDDLAKARRVALAEADALYQQALAQKESLKAELETEKQALKDRYEEEKRLIDDAQTKAKDAHTEKMRQLDEEKRQLDDIKQNIQDRYDLEIAALREKTPAEQALYDLQKRNLQAEIASGQLSGEALLQAQARLERMEAQEKIQQLQKQRSEELLVVEAQQKQNDQDRIKAQSEYADKQAALKKQEEELTRQYDDNVKALDAAFKEYEKLIEKSGELASALSENKTATYEAAIAQQTYNDRLQLGVEKAQEIYEWLYRAASITPGSSPPNNFAGGPVRGGSTYTVNELGKEAFLSASGRLSMINTPAWGHWTAPSSGTIIPAHLTRQLDIPAGGINLNSLPASGSARPRKSMFGRRDSTMAGVQSALSYLGGASQAQAQQLGKLSRAIDAMRDKDWKVNVNINGNNPLLNKLRRY